MKFGKLGLERLRNLSVALGSIANLVKDNRDNLKVDVTQLASITQILVKQKRNLTEFMDVAPLALSNLQNAFDPNTNSLATRGNFDVAQEPLKVLCDALPTAAKQLLCKKILGKLPTSNAPSVSRRATSLAQLLEATP